MLDKPGFVHSVYFWLHEGTSAEDRAAFHKGVEALTKCKTIQQAFIGPPAGTPREVVDNTYEIALLVFFKNKEDHDAYQVDPDHDLFINSFKHLWARVQIYDHLPV